MMFSCAWHWGPELLPIYAVLQRAWRKLCYIPGVHGKDVKFAVLIVVEVVHVFCLRVGYANLI